MRGITGAKLLLLKRCCHCRHRIPHLSDLYCGVSDQGSSIAGKRRLKIRSTTGARSAERVRFELTSPVKGLRFSRPVHSTALPPLHNPSGQPRAIHRGSPLTIIPISAPHVPIFFPIPQINRAARRVNPSTLDRREQYGPPPAHVPKRSSLQPVARGN